MAEYTDFLHALTQGVASGAGWIRTWCPECAEESTGHRSKKNLSLRVSTGWYRCWRCNTKGRVSLEALGIDATEYADTYEKVVQEHFDPPEGFMFLSDPASRAYMAPRLYLWGRGVSDDIISECQIGAVVSGPKYRASVIVPILQNGQWRGFVARSYRRKLYFNVEGMDRENLFFNGDELLVETDDPLMVVEGCFDALPYYPYAIAMLGKPSKNQFDLLARAKRPLAIVMDADAQMEGWALAARLSLCGVRVAFVKLPPGEDPGVQNPPELFARVVDEIAKT